MTTEQVVDYARDFRPKHFTVLVIGGTWHWAGPLIGGFIVAWLPDWLSSLDEWRIVVQGLVVIAMVLGIVLAILFALAEEDP